ncbi:hypothetical protein E4O03_00475 [Treponema sp. OMZ 792]|uniref:hypothetical protein n=1 Tax=unclassified Treponema TaxID=2638727 RepID=UPI0020A58622|nr:MULTISPECIES: hypothetical protein [unclassified Treponema]UTC75240.1 hypothetical protein E4O03_00475 [Treponema sp. OMZ 792]UTC79246.1 hypothetical protein E4O07_00485 [Treponema sp. OMZ 798]
MNYFIVIQKEIKKDSTWVEVDYMATWKYGYDFILDAVQVLIDMDFKDNTQKAATFFIAGASDEDHIEELRKANLKVRECPVFQKECGGISIAGSSSFMEVSFQICFFNQTNVIKLFCPVKEYFEKNGDRVFDNYLNSIEIKAYCADTERRVREELKPKLKK